MKPRIASSRRSRRFGRCLPLAPVILCVGVALSLRCHTSSDDQTLRKEDVAAAVPYACPLLDEVSGQLVGCVVDPSGKPVSGAVVSRESLRAESNARGVFAFTGVIPADNALLTITAEGFRTEYLVHRFTGDTGGDANVASSSRRSLPPIVLTPHVAGQTRFMFGGDVSFGRRFLDSDESTLRGEMPPEDDTALISVSNPVPGSQSVVSYIRPYFRDADLGVVNLETPVTRNVATPHPTKDYAYFTLPESLRALTELGVDYVSLGNNHVYDYLENGLADTLAELDRLGMPHSGAGLTVDRAFAPRVLTSGTSSYSMLSMTSIAGDEHAIHYVASARQGGAADLRDLDRVTGLIAREAGAGRFPIAQLHMGFEYTFWPTPGGVDRMKAAIDAGAALVISHHTHVAQGFGMYKNVLMAHCMGNLIFDQDRVETMLGVLLRVDMNGGTFAGARAIPVYLEDYRPRPVGDDLAVRFLRRLGEFSHGHGVTVVPYHGQGWIVPDSQPIVVDRRTIDVDIEIPETGWAVVDLRQLAAADESLEKISSGGTKVKMRAGRDLMIHGDFEDWDVDEVTGEVARWDAGETARVCNRAMRDSAALCLDRSADDREASQALFRNRVRVMGESMGRPNKDVTLVTYARGNNAGAVFADITYAASVDEREFGSESLPLLAPGSYDWTMSAIPIAMPPDDPKSNRRDATAHPRALQLVLRHQPPAAGTGTLEMDDIAVINWEENIEDRDLPVPHARDFVRVEGPRGKVRLTLTLTRMTPAVATAR